MPKFAPVKLNTVPVKFVFLVLPEMHLLDLAGPEQVIHTAMGYGADFEIEYCGIGKQAATSTGMCIAGLKSFKSIQINRGDYLIIAGAYTGFLFSDGFRKQQQLFAWIQKKYDDGVNICSICTGAYVLAYTGILNNKPCTTHWQLTMDMQRRFPEINVLENVLFVNRDNVYTSAGIVSGIDMTLAIVEDLKGSYFAHKVARELVIYNRRNADQSQHSDFLSYRNHIHAGIHQVQDWLYENLSKKATLPQLAAVANMSSRNFTRVFKKETRVTVNDYVTTLRKERINELLKNPDISRSQIAKQCGLKSERQVSRLINN